MADFLIPVVDYSNEKSTVKIRVLDAIGDAALTAIFDAVDGVTIGNPGQSTLNTSAEKDAGTGVPPANQFAQRELKWLAKYQDNVNNRTYRFEIPCADASLLTANVDRLDLTSGPGAALKSAIDANAKSQDGNAVTLVSVELVGRNS